MNTPAIAPLAIEHGRRARDIELVLRFDPAAPPARTEVVLDCDTRLDAEAYLALVTNAAARLVLYADDYRQALEADRGDRSDDDGARRRSTSRRYVPRRHGLRLPTRGAWSLQTRQDGGLVLLDPTGRPVVIASHDADQQRLRRLFGRMTLGCATGSLAPHT